LIEFRYNSEYITKYDAILPLSTKRGV